MPATAHPFTNTDAEYGLIKALLLDIETRPEIDNNWDPARMDWWRYNTHAGKSAAFFATHARYWTDGDRVIGLFISEYGRDDVFIVVHPDRWDVFDEMLRWGIDVWARDKAKITTDIYTFGAEKIERLKAAGFYEDGHVENVRIYPLASNDFGYALPPGFRLMPFAEYGDYDSRVELVRRAFGNPNFTEARYRSTQGTPGYRPELDLVIVSDAGQAVGYCMGWIEEIDPTSGYIEPMGVHPDFRRRGLGTALCKACFARLAALGAERAWIASNAEPDISNHLYDALKPSRVKRSYRYALDLSPPR